MEGFDYDASEGLGKGEPGAASEENPLRKYWFWILLWVLYCILKQW